MPTSFLRSIVSISLAALLSTIAPVAIGAANADTAPAPQAVAEPPAATKTDADNNEITSFTLGNGLEVVMIPDHRAPVVTHMIWYHVGSADELPGKSGIAHFLEHLMFKATKNYPAGEFGRKVAEIGGQENAFTSNDYTAYYQQLAPQALEMAMTYEADRMENLVLTDEVVATERQVILEERRSRVDNSPSGLLAEEVNATLYQNHPYRLPVIGWLHEMEKLGLDDALAFYEKYYTPNNATLVISGDVTADLVKTLAEKTYGKVPRRAEPGKRERPQEPEQNTKRIVSLADPRVSRPSFQKRWVAPSYANARPGEAEALDLLSEILGGSPRGRLYQTLVVSEGVAAAAGAFFDGNGLDSGSFALHGSPRGEASLEDVERGVDAQVENIIKNGVTQEELDAARNRFLKSIIFARDSQTGMARIYGSTLSVGQTIKDIQEWPDRIKAVKKEDIQEVARRYLVDGRSVTAYLMPEAGAPDKKAKDQGGGGAGPSEVLPAEGTVQ
ncbi:insulinase family protein [Phyllobacterium sp. 21LDTY02-6]|uniref:M16 family metallopeptidase n=1 Tax=Phyllobacterium sp. 21LDTY02-6 TaxID=2944903 RepID=UPI00201FE3F5|nr:pitrilysin family protein [Phyllobacterium sp. 21LDTY02-6]MCO4318663.1 insulinase family protein [Phyllobacterium sp. 21LDTY02-6]